MADSTVGVLREFLVAIGFKVDENSLSKFDNALTSITLKAVKLGAEVEAAATAVVLGVTKIASSMEQLYYASARTHTSVQNIQAFTFSVAQLGGTVQGAQASLENLGNFLRSSPAAASLINSLGVATSANGRPRQETDILADLSEKFSAMPIWRAQAYAGRLGIDQNTLFAMINGLGRLSAAYKQMYAAAGLDPSGGSQQAHNFMVQIRTLGAAFDILAIKVEASLSGAIGGDIERFRQLIVSNFGNISQVITWLAKGFVALADLFTGALLTAFHILEKLYDAFQHLDPVQKQWIEGIAGVILAWKALNIAFSTSPIGIILTLAAALSLLYQDYETWLAGGKSLIDWKKWEPDIEKAKAFLVWFGDKLNDVASALGGWNAVFAGFLTYFMATWSVAIIGRLAVILGRIAAVGIGLAGIGGGAAAAGGAAAGGAAAGAADASAGALGGWSLAGLIGGIGAGAYAFFGNPFGMYGQSEAPLSEDDHLGNYDFKPGGGDKAKQIRDLLVTKFGWSQAAAEGIVANMSAETGGTFDPASVGDNGQAYGIGQWHADRQADFAKLFGKPIQGSSLGEQIAFYSMELRGHAGGMVLDRGAAAAGKMLSDPSITSGQAAADVSVLGERPADKLGSAIARAKIATGYHGSMGPVGGSGTTIIIHQKNDTKIETPNAPTASQLAEHQGRVNQRNIRNLAGAVNRS